MIDIVKMKEFLDSRGIFRKIQDIEDFRFYYNMKKIVDSVKIIVILWVLELVSVV